MADHARGEQLRHLRHAHHLSQEEAAHRIGVSTKSVRAWEQGGKIRWDNTKRQDNIAMLAAKRDWPLATLPAYRSRPGP